MVKWIYLLVFLWPGSVLASLPVSWPSSLDDVDYTIGNGGTVAIVWQQSNGTWFCGAGSLTNAPSLILNLPGKGDETFSEYLERVKAKIFTRELTELEVNLCNVLLIRNREEWIVDQYREYPTRPVYQITDAFPSVKERIGNVNHGEPCGTKVAPYSATITKYEWREVISNEGQKGASVCRQK